MRLSADLGTHVVEMWATSPKTIEYHLGHVSQKLGIHSRDELARQLGEQSVTTAAALPVSAREA